MAKNYDLINEMASSRIKRLYDLAYKKTVEDKGSAKLSKRYIKIAKAISAHYKVKMPKSVKGSVCKKCSSVLVPGINCRVRIIQGKTRLYICSCGAANRLYTTKG